MARFIWRNEFGPDRTRTLTIKKADGTLPVHRRRTVAFTGERDERLYFDTNDQEEIDLLMQTDAFKQGHIYLEGHSGDNGSRIRFGPAPAIRRGLDIFIGGESAFSYLEGEA